MANGRDGRFGYGVSTKNRQQPWYTFASLAGTLRSQSNYPNCVPAASDTRAVPMSRKSNFKIAHYQASQATAANGAKSGASLRSSALLRDGNLRGTQVL